MEKVLVSLDHRLLARIDHEAKRRGLTRSAYLARIAERELGARNGPGRQGSVRRAMDRLDALFRRHGMTEDATAAIRAERDAR
jgi:hypothetical protein